VASYLEGARGQQFFLDTKLYTICVVSFFVGEKNKKKKKIVGGKRALKKMCARGSKIHCIFIC